MIVSIIVVAFVLFASSGQAETKQEVIHQISTISQAAEIDPDLAVAIATVESGLNPKAVGALGEVGLFQLRPEFHQVIRGDVKQNIMAGVSNLAYVKSRCESKYRQAWFVAHNYGPKCNLKWPTKTGYYKRVMKALDQIKVKRYLAVK